MDLFDKPVYLYGKILKNKLITPFKSYEITLPKDLKADYLPVKLENNKLVVFYSSEIFNSYVISIEENVYTLFHPDGKLTITHEKIEEGRIYTFIVEKEDSNLRRVSLYKFDTLYPGTRTLGRVVTRKNKYFVSTIYGEGELVLQNNFYGKKIEILLYRKDDTLHFVQVDNPVQTKTNVKIDSNISGYYTVSNGNIRGILFSNTKYNVGSTLDVIPKDNNLGFYIFEEYKPIFEGQEIDAEIVKIGKGKASLRYGGHNGFMKGHFGKNRKVNGIILSIEDGVFELVKKKCKSEKKSLNEDLISIPFEFQSDDEAVDENIDVGNTINVDLNLERKRSRLVNDDDFMMEIKAYPGKAHPILKYFKYLVEQNRQDEASSLFFEYNTSLVGKERDDLSIAFVNYLIYTSNPTLYQIVKKLSQNCSIRFLEVISANTNDVRIAKLYYTTFPNKNSYRRYLEILFSADIKEGYKLMEANPKYLHFAIPLLYKYGDNQRNRIEKLISKNREAWFEYLENETGEYKRHLFRRVVEYDWNKKDMKNFFKMWLEFETEQNGNVDEVRSRAKEYVEKMKSKEENTTQ